MTFVALKQITAPAAEIPFSSPAGTLTSDSTFSFDPVTKRVSVDKTLLFAGQHYGERQKVTTTLVETKKVFAFRVPVNRAVMFAGMVIARIKTGANAGKAAFVGLEAVYRNIGGTLTLAGSSVGTPLGDVELAAIVVAAAVNGDNLNVNVTGLALIDIDWACVGNVSLLAASP